ncbi:MAG: HEPN domain-containing protein [Candidatus Stahlbacteria bacterium]|nr:HEPN domain-containing protein [Candidatus Stahlbacteria bacterium]
MDKQTLELTKEWIKKAENDLRSAEYLITMELPPTDTICFHSEQCAEKYLKGFLTIKGIEFERSHDLDYLLDECKRENLEFEELRDIAEDLTPYAVEIRYPDDFVEISVNEASEAIEKAKKVKNFVLGLLQKLLQQS